MERSFVMDFLKNITSVFKTAGGAVHAVSDVSFEI